MPIETRVGCETYWQVIGSGEGSALALHCSLASSDAWRSVGGVLGDRMSLTAPDFIGHGKSQDWDQTSDLHHACAQVAASFLTKPQHVIGHSFGATVALRLAIENPDLVKSLTLIEPVFFAAAIGSPEYKQHLTEFKPFEKAVQNNDLNTAARVFTEVWGTGTPWDDLPDKMRDALAKRIHLIPATIGALYDDNAGLTPRLGAIHCPVQLIEGANSPEIIAAIGTVLVDRIPDARRAVIAVASHMVPITHARQVAQIIDGFLSL